MKIYDYYSPLATMRFGYGGDSGALVWIDGAERFDDQNGEVYGIGILIAGMANFGIASSLNALQAKEDRLKCLSKI